MTRERIAVVGAGISGLVAARRLSTDHDVTIFEAAPYVGGHTNTIDVVHEDGVTAVDTGFIVFNDRTYPNFVRLLDELGVESQPSDMGFSVRCDRTGLEYNGASLDTIFAQRRNVLRPSFYRMLRDILRFNRAALELLDEPDDSITLGEYLARGGYSRQFVDHYLVPMGAAIWSARPSAMLEFPAPYFVRFFANHGMLTIGDRPTWRVVKGGSRTYVEALLDEFPGTVRTSTPIDSVRRFPDHVDVWPAGSEPERFDAVFLATHSDTALRMLADPKPVERDVLGAIPYQRNEAVLHTDERLMPRRKRAWAAWNYHIGVSTDAPVAVTYNMNILQSLDVDRQFLVTLNRTDEIADDAVIARIVNDHPVFTPAGVAAQARVAEISGHDRTYYCGAYWGFGFHEDGVRSGIDAVQRFVARHGVLAR